MTAGVTPSQASLLTGTAGLCEGLVASGSIWALLYREGGRLFPDAMFDDLFALTGRRSVPPRVVATVMVCQRLLGLSDREAVEAFSFDVRWKYACGGLDFDYPGFAHTVLVDMRARLDRSDDKHRIRDATIAAAGAAGLVGVRRVLDSTPLYDAVATMDTITLIRSAIRNLFKAVAGSDVEIELRGAVTSGDEYVTTAKPQIDWDDKAARQALIDSRAKDAMGCLAVLDGYHLEGGVADAAVMVATVVGQDLDVDDDGIFRIARRVAADRVISTVDPDARHGHKTVHRSFDGYKGHISVDPDSEIITNSTVTAGNVADGTETASLVDELVNHRGRTPADNDADEVVGAGAGATKTVYGDGAYGTGEVLADLAGKGIDANVKTPKPQAPDGHFTKDDFDIDLEADTVTCPNNITRSIRWTKTGGTVKFSKACAACPLAASCTSSRRGRAVTISLYESELAGNRARQAEPARAGDYRQTRPKVERKLGHLMRRRHGGRRARVRGKSKVTADFNLLVAAANLARLARLGLCWQPTTGWTATP